MMIAVVEVKDQGFLPVTCLWTSMKHRTLKVAMLLADGYMALPDAEEAARQEALSPPPWIKKVTHLRKLYRVCSRHFHVEHHVGGDSVLCVSGDAPMRPVPLPKGYAHMRPTPPRSSHGQTKQQLAVHIANTLFNNYRTDRDCGPDNWQVKKLVRLPKDELLYRYSQSVKARTEAGYPDTMNRGA